MKYGLIGGRLSHSFSPEIHKRLDSNPYELKELNEEELDAFLKAKDFSGINVTLPYKERVIPYLYAIDYTAEKIGAVNTVVNEGGRLIGYNTDYHGMLYMLRYHAVTLEKKTVAILGSGGTSKTAMAVCEHLGAKKIYRVSRSAGDGVITYERLYEIAREIDAVINTTPVGMYPDVNATPIDLDKFPALSAVVDVIYNPLRSALLMKAEKKGIKAVGGLYMLVAQAVVASEKFLGKAYSPKKYDGIYNELHMKKGNIVLIGMPSSGKSTVGKILAEKLGREFIDTDRVIEEMTEREVSQIFAKGGEALFREKERAAIKEVAAKSGAVIATGGGAVLCAENIDRLKRNGRIFFLDRPLASLTPTADRPLSPSEEALRALYDKRYPLYQEAADSIVKVDCDASSVAEKIISEFKYGI